MYLTCSAGWVARLTGLPGSEQALKGQVLPPGTPSVRTLGWLVTLPEKGPEVQPAGLATWVSTGLTGRPLLPGVMAEGKAFGQESQVDMLVSHV